MFTSATAMLTLLPAAWEMAAFSSRYLLIVCLVVMPTTVLHSNMLCFRQVDGASHVVHSEQEVAGTRLLVDSGTCLLANEHDPSRVLALSAGKLIRFLVERGDHVKQDQPYAEVEVMKMIMPLLAPAPGKVHFNVQEGGLLNAGDLIATLELDDPSESPLEQAIPEFLRVTILHIERVGVFCG